MANSTAPFAKFEWMIAWRYIRAKRAEGGVSVMTWISLIGVTLAVFALIATLAVRSGFRAEIVDTIVGANAHVTVYQNTQIAGTNQVTRLIQNYEDAAERIKAVPGVTRAAPLVRGIVLANRGNASTGVEIYGIAKTDILGIPRIAAPEVSQGSLDRFEEGIAIGSEVARTLGANVGDKIRVVNPNGTRGPTGITPRTNVYEIVYIFTAGRIDIDKTRAYLPLAEAQRFMNRDNVVDEIEVTVVDPDKVTDHLTDISLAVGDGVFLWTWLDSSSAFLRALTVEDNVMFIILSILVLVASMNIISGLIMLVKNKGRDVGILRTMGLTEGSILRIFFICGAGIGTLGTILGVVFGVLFVINIDTIFSFVNYVSGGGVWDPEIRGIYKLPAELHLWDVMKAVILSLSLSWIITIFPARRAARMNPVEALRYE